MVAKIRIRWDESVEFIEFSPSRAQKPHQTVEHWNDGTDVVYTVQSELSKAADGTRTLRIDYLRQENDDLLGLDIDWGYTLITFRTGDQKGRATWFSDAPEEKGRGYKKTWRIASEADEREQEQRWTKRTMRASTLRADLVNMRCACALTRTPAVACDAAHIVGVNEKGYDIPDNAMLLRADLHRLFDRRLFDIDTLGKVYRVKDTLPAAYKSELRRHSVISAKDFKRVKGALRQRARGL